MTHLRMTLEIINNKSIRTHLRHEAVVVRDGVLDGEVLAPHIHQVEGEGGRLRVVTGGVRGGWFTVEVLPLLVGRGPRRPTRGSFT